MRVGNSALRMALSTAATIAGVWTGSKCSQYFSTSVGCEVWAQIAEIEISQMKIEALVNFGRFSEFSLLTAGRFVISASMAVVSR